MGSIIYFSIISVQFLSVLATQPIIPLKCFLRDNKVFDLIGKSSIQPSLVKNLPQIDNLKVDSVVIDKDDFLFDTTNVEYIGLDKAILDDFGFNFVYNVSRITFHTDLLLSSPYKTNGTLFSIPIDGEENIQFGLTMPFEIIEANGNKFIELKEFFYWYDVKDYAHFKLDNLYYGNKEKSDRMHYLLNQNWKYIVTHFGDVHAQKIADNIFDIFKKYMLDLPLKDINDC
ncbi:unnamed protein product [Euphydryas editha]|uniref:Circadian clock-controlled protein n=1 Tax=Euphydryas editha TaxID=104508 RepID=A0AAU9TDD5_EUPED|nr:unnamed protein product [Euphydryas editha]